MLRGKALGVFKIFMLVCYRTSTSDNRIPSERFTSPAALSIFIPRSIMTNVLIVIEVVIRLVQYKDTNLFHSTKYL